MQFSEEVIARAHTLLERDQIEQDAEHPNIWWVTSLAPEGHRYRVQHDFDPEKGTISWVTCTCAHGLNTGAGQTHCYHVAAVLIRVREGSQA